VNTVAPFPRSDESRTEALDPRVDLVERLATSPTFERSKRLRDLLRFLCTRALQDPHAAIREQEIGAAVFGRNEGFDPSADTLVRVHASQLRKRLQQYFAGEGAHELLVIEIPKGTYVPVFREREKKAGEPPAPAEHSLPEPARNGAGQKRLVLGLGILTVALAALSCWLLLDNRAQRQKATLGIPPRPTVDRLWKQMFVNGHHTYVILADSMITMFQDAIRMQLTPTHYQRQQFMPLARERVTDPVALDFAQKFLNRHYTTVADAHVARRVTLLNALHGIPTDLLLAREANPQHFQSHNAILSGPRRANPWLDLFEQRLNFRSGFDEENRRAFFDNSSPAQGEADRYVVQWDKRGFCRVAYLPNLDGTGSVLLLSGTDMSSSDAGAAFITSERWVEELQTALGLRKDQPFPHFEVLLQANLVVGAAPTFERIAHRVLKP
jgi:hypothetical protein